MNIVEIKTRLEDSEKFKYHKQEEKIYFEDFRVIDINSNIIMQKGSEDYTIMVDGKKLSAYYPIQ